MTYLKEFGLSDEDLKEIYDSLTDEDWLYITTTKVQIKELLKYLTSLGITNIKDICIHKPLVLYQYADDMKKYIEESNIDNIIEMLKDDVYSFSLLGF